MHRLLFTLVPVATGWQLYEGPQGRACYPHFDEARDSARLMAATLHEHHGIPTAVIVGMGAESVMLAVHG